MGQATSSQDNRSTRDQGAPPTSSQMDTLGAFGLLELAPGDDANIDIVAIHGLDGHRESSWTANNGTLWLRDLLPAQMPRARIFTYGYDVNTRGQDELSTASLHMHAMNLIGHLASKRERTSTEQRPIIFIAHSLGGILLKDALIYANACGRNNLPSYKAIDTSTAGVLFFGTPHRGSKGANLMTVVLNILSALGKGTTKIVKVIQTNSEILEKQFLQYQAISANYATKVYFETYKTPLTPFTKSLLVPQASADIHDRNAEVIPLNKNHVNMVKFESGKDEVFQLVSGHLSTMAAAAPQKIVDRWKVQRTSETLTIEGGTIAKADPVPPVSGGSSRTNLKIGPAPLPLLPYQDAGESFVGRADVLNWIHETFKKHHKIALYGIGGIGKTGIAVQYIYTHRHDYDIILWVNGDTLETMTLGFISSAEQLVRWKSEGSAASSTNSGRDYSWVALELGLDGFLDGRGKVSKKMEDRDDITKAVKEWLSGVKNENWLMVFDNVDDLDSFDLTTFFPTPLPGRILITSRNQESRFIGAGYEVPALSQDDGVKLLVERSCKKADEDASRIVQMLEGLPLAIELAGAYIAALQLSFKAYIATMNEPWKHVFTENIRPYGRSLVAAWEISFRAIESRSPSAANLLLICGFLGSEDIPEVLFQGKLGVVTINEALKHLFAFSLAKRGPSETSFSIHPLVHAWTRERLGDDQKAEKIKETVVLLGDTISQMPRAWSHTFISANYALEYCLPKLQANSDIVIFESLEKIAEREGGKLLQAMFRMALEATRGVEGPNSIQTFRAMELLGCSYFGYMHCPISPFLQNALQKERTSPLRMERYLQGEVGRSDNDKYRQAGGDNAVKRQLNITEQREEGERLVRCALEGRERIQGSDHHDTLKTIQLLGHLIYVQRRYQESEDLERHALKCREKTLGLDHTDTLYAMRNLASTMHQQGRFNEAERLSRRALEGREKLLGINHADTLESFHSLAVLIHAQGRFQEAEKLSRRALEGREKLLGINHADTLKSVHSLAVSIYAQGRFEEAEKLNRRALKGYEKLLGINHADTLLSVHQLAVSIHSQGRFEEAERLGLRALQGREKLLGINHADTLKSVHELAASTHAQGRFEEAEKLFRRAVVGREKLLGINNANTLKSVHQLAVSIHAQGRVEEAERLERRALEGREKLFGLNHAATLKSVHSLAVLVHDQGRFGEAENLKRRALEGREKLLGINHTDTLRSIHSLAVSIYDQGRYEEAEKLDRRALERREKLLVLHHADTLQSVRNLSISIWAQRRYAEVEILERRTVAGYENLFGPDHVNTLEAVHNLTQTLCKQGKFNEAEQLGRRAVEGRKKILGMNHKDTLESATYLARSIREQGRFGEARKPEKWVAEGNKTIL